MKLELKAMITAITLTAGFMSWVWSNTADTTARITQIEAKMKNVVTSERIARLEEKLDTQINALDKLTPVVANLDRSLIKLETTLSLMIEDKKTKTP